ncbi:MAG TPA: S8 family serine peptidase, partial [Candidatus Eisenbacteria bacterium]|nr:S8 family serine peptidase [Candidatus Eisenbacteria bacterium]
MAQVPIQVRDAFFVLSYQRFDPASWSSLPEGSQWTVAPYGGKALALSSLGLTIRNETVVWWAVVGRDRRTGSLVASHAGHFTLLPRFANRMAPDATAHPSATGALSVPAPLAHTPIELTAGYTFTPGGARPALPADLARMVPAEPTMASSGRRAYLVQFVGLSASGARRRIEQIGGSVVSALTGETFLARLDAAEAARLESEDDAPWMGEWEPAYKLSPQVDRMSAAPAELRALVFPDGDVEGARSTLAAIGATDLRVSKNGVNQIIRFTLPGASVARAAALADIEWIEPVVQDSILNDQDQWVLQTGVSGSRRIWDMGIRGQGQVLMDADSGVRPNHEMFADAAGDITDFGDYPDHRKIIAYKRASDAPVIEFGDDAGSSFHGTHTSGTVCGNSDPTSSGQYDGIAKDAKLYFMDMAGSHSNGILSPPEDLNDLFRPSYLGNAGGAARISSNSWGAAVRGAYDLYAMEVDQFMWSHPDYLAVFANGNNFLANTVQSPGSAKNCLSVGSTGNGDQMNTFSNFTSRGPCADLRRKPTVCAPGDGVTSSIGNTRYSYASYSGTSMATPGAAASCALVREYLAEGWYPTGAPVAANAMTPSAALLKAMAMNSGDGGMAGYYIPDNNVGWGRMNLDNVLYFPGDARRTWLADEKQGLADQQYVEYQIQVDDPTQPLEISLVWTDAPGNPAAARAIVNDLDLKVMHGATTYYGNYMFNNVSLTGANATRDSINVEEGVRVPSPGAGPWTVRIEAHRVLVGPQPFALVVTGGVGQEAGSIALDRFDYALGDTVGVEVLDGNAASPLTVTASSPTDPWGESVTLTGSNGVFHGTLVIAPSIPNPSDHVLAVSSGDAITVAYADHSPAATVSAQATIHSRAPTISNVMAQTLGSTSALVTWSTDQPASSRVS